MVEQKEVINGVQIKYKYKQRKYDTQHIIFVFCGFGSASMFTYDFENALQDCPAHVVWIKDDFNDCCAYYLCQNMDYSIEQAVITFIENMLTRYDLDRSCCTLAGFSKGGSAALYYGLKYHFINIISTVPQFHIGSFANREWPHVLKHMTGTANKKSITLLDTLLPQLLLNDNFLEKNIYLLTSEADYQYEGEIKPYIDTFRKYHNFNIFMATSQLIREHNQVTSYHVPLLLGIFYSLSQGAIPRYGDCKLIADNTLFSRPVKPQPVALLKRIAVTGTLIFPEGIAVLKGVSCGEYQDIQVDLVFKNEEFEEVFRIAKAHRSILSRQLYAGGFVNYDKGWFCTPKFQGLNLQGLPVGRYLIFLDITCQEHYARKALEVDAGADNKLLASSESVDVYSQNGHVYLWKKN